MAHRLFHVGIKALVIDEQGRVLLLKTPAWKNVEAHWDLPGGRMEENHTVEATLRREIGEELGISEVSNIAYFSACVSNMEIPLKDGGTVGLVLMAYTATIPDNSPIVLSDEHTTFEWVNHAEAADRLTYKYPKEFTAALLKLDDAVAG